MTQIPKVVSVSILFIASVIVSKCATPMRLKSTPSGAAVTINGKAVGSTPLSIDRSILPSAQVTNGYLAVLTKDGYRDMTVILPNNSGNVEANVIMYERSGTGETTKLRDSVAAPSVENITAYYKQLEKDADLLLSLQVRLLEAQAVKIDEIQQIQKRYPKISATYYLEALSHRLNGNLPLSKKAIEEAILRSSGDTDYIRLLELVK